MRLDMKTRLRFVEKKFGPEAKRNLEEILDEGSDTYICKTMPQMLAGDKYARMQHLVDLLNAPQVDKNGNLFPQYEVMKRIVEGLSTRALSASDWVETKFASLALGPEFNPSEKSVLSFFNQMAQENPITLRIAGVKMEEELLRDDGKVRISTAAEGSPVGLALFFLWQDYFKGGGWRRVKICPTCGRWYVDRSRNRSAKTCSRRCSNSGRWSWQRRQEIKSQPGYKPRIRKKRQQNRKAKIGANAKSGKRKIA